MPVRWGLLVALVVSTAARAEEEPTPFWLPPPASAPAKPARKPAKRKPVQIEPLEIKRKEKLPVVEKRKAPPAREPRSMEPTWVDPAPRPAEPLPRAEPLRQKHAPLEIEPVAPPLRSPAVPAPPISAPPEAPAERAPPAVQPAPSGPAAVAIPAVPAPEQPSAALLAEPEPEPASDDLRRWSVDATFGAWGKSRSDGSGRDWQLAYGLRFGRAIVPALELELELLRAGGSAGSPFVSASATHNLAALRAFWVLGDTTALLLGGGAGVALAQTHYTLQPSTDPGVAATGLDANAPKSVIEITAAVRLRIFRGLEARAEVSAAARDGKLEILPLLGAGAAF